MKTKKFRKKLALNKKTIATLNNGNMMGNVVGGGDLVVHGQITECTSCYLGPTDCPDCTAPSGCETNCGTCDPTCVTCYSVCITICDPRGAMC